MNYARLTRVVALMTLAAASCLLAQPSGGAAEDSGLQWVNEQISEFEAFIQQCRVSQTMVLSLSLLIGVLGIATSIIQSLNRGWTKTTTVIIGGCVSVLTLFSTLYFKVDHRTYEKTIVEARKLLKEARFRIGTYKEIPATDRVNREAALRELRDIIDKFPEVEKLVIGASADFSIPVVYAVDRDLPSWTRSSVSEDKSRFLYVGRGESNLLAQAKLRARANAVTRATADAAHRIKGDHLGQADRIAAVRAYVDEAIEEGESVYEYQHKTQMFVYYERYQLRKSAVWFAPVGKLSAPQLPPKRLEVSTQIPQHDLVTQRKVSRSINAPALPGEKGAFRFNLSFIRKGPHAISLTLDDIEIHQDGSSGSTRWLFDIVIGGHHAIRLPMQRFDDTKKPTRCVMGESADVTLSQAVRPIDVRVIGYSPN